MIYVETILDNNDTFAIERQKNKPNGEWYGLSLHRGWERRFMADNDEFIFDLLSQSPAKLKKSFTEMEYEYNKDRAKLLLKLLKKADKLGWFNHLK